VCPMCRVELPPGPEKLHEEKAARRCVDVNRRVDRGEASWGALTKVGNRRDPCRKYHAGFRSLRNPRFGWSQPPESIATVMRAARWSWLALAAAGLAALLVLGAAWAEEVTAAATAATSASTPAAAAREAARLQRQIADLSRANEVLHEARDEALANFDKAKGSESGLQEEMEGLRAELASQREVSMIAATDAHHSTCVLNLTRLKRAAAVERGYTVPYFCLWVLGRVFRARWPLRALGGRARRRTSPPPLSRPRRRSTRRG